MWPKKSLGARSLARGMLRVGCRLLLAILGSVPLTRLRAQTKPDSTPTERRLARPLIHDLTLAGMHAGDRATLLNSLATTPSHCKSILLTPFCWFTKSHFFFQKEYLDRTEFARDVLRIKIYYWWLGYRETQVDTAVYPRGHAEVNITFTIREGPPVEISQVSLTPDSLFTKSQLNRLMRLHKGQPLDLLAVDSTRMRFLQALWRRGYADAKVDTVIDVDMSTHTSTVHYVAEPKQQAVVDSIHITGNIRIDSTTIRHALAFQPGHLLLREDMTNGQRTLYQSNLFQRASITYASDSGRPDSLKTVTVTVQESPLHAVQVSGGFNQLNFVQVGAKYTNYNWLGHARELDITGSVGNLFANALNNQFPFYDVYGLAHRGDSLNTGKYLAPTWDANLNVKQPWVGGPANTIGAGIFDHQHSFPGIYIDNGYGAQASFTRQLSEHVNASLTYRYELTQVTASQVYFCVNYGACDLPTISLLQERRSLSPLALSVTWDQSSGGLSPVDGFVLRAELQHASALTLSDYRYDRAYITGTYYRRIAHHQGIAFHAEAGLVQAIRSGIDTGALHPRTRFYAGGSQSVRGFGENQLGPEVLTVSPTALAGACGTTINTQTCDPNGKYYDSTLKKTIGIPNSAFTPAPLGGTRLLEGSVEYRYPIVGALGGAFFIDAGYLGQNSFHFSTSGQAAVTPGLGLRYYSVVGPIRVDLGYNPWSVRSLPVVTQIGSGTQAKIVPLAIQRTFRPPGLLNVLVLHLSIGQAF